MVSVSVNDKLADNIVIENGCRTPTNAGAPSKVSLERIKSSDQVPKITCQRDHKKHRGVARGPEVTSRLAIIPTFNPYFKAINLHNCA